MCMQNRKGSISKYIKNAFIVFLLISKWDPGFSYDFFLTTKSHLAEIFLCTRVKAYHKKWYFSLLGFFSSSEYKFILMYSSQRITVIRTYPPCEVSSSPSGWLFLKRRKLSDRLRCEKGVCHCLI